MVVVADKKGPKKYDIPFSGGVHLGSGGVSTSGSSGSTGGSDNKGGAGHVHYNNKNNTNNVIYLTVEKQIEMEAYVYSSSSFYLYLCCALFYSLSFYLYCVYCLCCLCAIYMPATNLISILNFYMSI